MMLHFGTETDRFLYRVAGVAVINRRVLIHDFESDRGLYCLPGGRVEMGETAEEAVAREMREELGCEIRIRDLLFVIDNHFTHRGVRQHELGLYFAIELPVGCMQASGQPLVGEELDGTKLFFRWQPVDELAKLNLNPSCLVEHLRELPEHTQYILHRDP
jgi:ADP-ribose pyrophosphatase YjhB (NUDIX family)